MNTQPLLTLSGKFQGLIAAGLILLPSLASAHPGHFHPEENDEFDAVRANFLHLHGSLEIGLACVALAAAAVFKMNSKRPVRVAAAVAFGASIASIAAF